MRFVFICLLLLDLMIPGFAENPNIVILTLDDMDKESVGVYGCPLPGVTPHIDQLAGESMRFENAYVPTAVCQPSRQSLMTGQFAHRNGTFGFIPLSKEAETIGKMVKSAGYFTASIGKGRDYSPVEAHGWDYFVYWARNWNRRPEHIQSKSREAIALARDAGKPLFLNINSSDPHRPFIGSDQEADFQKKMERWDEAWVDKNPLGEADPKLKDYYIAYGCEVEFDPAEVPVPGYLPDLPEIRAEVAEYYTSVKRGDEAVGLILELLEEEGIVENTLLFFFSDHGASFPSSKSDTFPHSTNVPFLVRWPGHVKGGAYDADSFISTLDLFPTLAEILKQPRSSEWDGESLVPLLKGQIETQRRSRKSILATYNYRKPGNQVFPTRSITSKEFHYMYQPWVTELKRKPDSESHQGHAFKAIQAAAKKDDAASEYLGRYLKRPVEALYDLRTDPYCQKNIINVPDYSGALTLMRDRLVQKMKASNDPMLRVFNGELSVDSAFPF